MPRNRAARLAVLGSSVQRSSSASYTSRTGSALRRRLVVGILVVLALALITVSFREASGGSLHSLQNVGASVLRPFEVGAERVASPFRDVYGYFSGLAHAKSDNGRLRTENERLRQQAIQNETAVQENATLRRMLDYVDGPSFPRDYGYVATAVLGRSPTQFDQRITIAAGSNRGIRVSDPVVTPDGLVGQVTRVTSGTALVTLLTDDSSHVAALARSHGRQAEGLVSHGASGGDSLILDRVTKDQIVQRGDQVITAGSQVGQLPSIYPKGIPIGTVTSAGQTDTDPFKNVQLAPFVDFASLHSVLVLIPKKAPASLP